MLLVAYTQCLGRCSARQRLGRGHSACRACVPLPRVRHLALDSLINAALVDGVDGSRWALAKMFNFTALRIDRTYDAIAHAVETQYIAV